MGFEERSSRLEREDEGASGGLFLLRLRGLEVRVVKVERVRGSGVRDRGESWHVRER